jgi:large subunit ribosomal protein L43
MCSRGVFQLSLLKIIFSDLGGSSKGVREMLKSPQLKEFAIQNPHLSMKITLNRSCHPHLQCNYINGFSKAVPLVNTSPTEAMSKIIEAYSTGGHSAYKHACNKVITSNKSIQGKYTPGIAGNIENISMFQQKDIAEYPYQPPEMITIRQKRNLHPQKRGQKFQPHLLGDLKQRH